MRNTATALAGAFTIAVAACAQFGQLASGQSVLPASAQVTAAKGTFAFDIAYNGAASAYLAEKDSLSPPVRNQAKALLLKMLTCPPGVTDMTKCTGYVATAHAAETAGDSASLAAAVANIEALSAQVTALAKGH